MDALLRHESNFQGSGSLDASQDLASVFKKSEDTRVGGAGPLPGDTALFGKGLVAGMAEQSFLSGQAVRPKGQQQCGLPRLALWHRSVQDGYMENVEGDATIRNSQHYASRSPAGSQVCGLRFGLDPGGFEKVAFCNPR